MSNVTIQTFTGGIAATNGHFLSLPGGNVLVDAPEGVAAWLEKLGLKVDVLFHPRFSAGLYGRFSWQELSLLDGAALLSSIGLSVSFHL